MNYAIGDHVLAPCGEGTIADIHPLYGIKVKFGRSFEWFQLSQLSAFRAA